MSSFKIKIKKCKLETYMTCDVLNAVWVKVLLAFPTVLFEVNLKTHHTSVRAAHSNYRFWPPM